MKRWLLFLAVLMLIPASAGAWAEPSPQDRSSALELALKAIVGPRKVGIAVLPVGDTAQVMTALGVNGDDQYSVASAFKGPVAIYFFENTDSSVWGHLPVAYWNVDKEAKVPDEFLPVWEQFHVILKAVYQMAVYSENDSTGNVLAYVYRTIGSSASSPIVAFNEWSHGTVGIGDKSGMEAWFAGGSSCLRGCTDSRFGQGTIIYRGKIVLLGNSYSPRDLATFYVHLATRGRELGYYDVAMELLSVRKEYPSLTKTYGGEVGIQVASKDGFVGPYSEGSNGFYVSTDAGLFTLADGEQYAVAFMALDAGDILHRAIRETSITLVKNANLPATPSATVTQP
ncbi:MAG TPA: hypothetical protein VMT34_04555 [Aggregatilineales bacterium]|nr:hypothetical protein [Aggregatilineales bacterium]